MPIIFPDLEPDRYFVPSGNLDAVSFCAEECGTDWLRPTGDLSERFLNDLMARSPRLNLEQPPCATSSPPPPKT